MRQAYLFISLIIILLGCHKQDQFCPSKLRINSDWLFYLGDTANACEFTFNDTLWRKLDLPHDFSIEQPLDSTNLSAGGGAFAYGGIAWYRKHLEIPVDYKDKRVVVQFEGVYRNSEVWINGHYLGIRPYGYSTFAYDLSPFLKFDGTDNILAVKVNTADQPNSRWYTGAGIYRNVNLIISDKIFIPVNGVFAHTLEIKNGTNAMVNVDIDVACFATLQNVQIYTELKDDQNRIVASDMRVEDIPVNDTLLIHEQLVVGNAHLWNVDDPYLYELTTRILSGKKVLDEYKTTFGIRTFAFSPNQGFFINGQHLKLKGVNNHHDGGPLGAACYDRTFERQVEILKSMGCNALRMSHNPPAPELLACADKMGMLVIDEIFDEWEYPKREYGYSKVFNEWFARDVADWIKRDRNHACIIAWSLGNEIPEQTSKQGTDNFNRIKEEAIKYDSTRPFTGACNEIPGGNASGYTQAMDIVGYNYRQPHYKADHETYLDRIIFGSETVIYPYQPGNDFPLCNYDDWYQSQTADYVAGEFLWTGFDYLGEAGIGLGGTSYEPWLYWPSWPYRSAVCGVVDLCGFKKPAYYFRKALWTNDPLVYMAVETDPSAKDRDAAPFWGWPMVEAHWNHCKTGELLAVQVYTNCDSVELFLNDKSLGTKAWDLQKEAFLVWNVPYEPGLLKAIGSKKDGSHTSFELKTAGGAAQIQLIADKDTLKANGADLSYIEVHVNDADGNLVPLAKNQIKFTIQGDASIMAVGNGNPTSLTSFKGNEMKAYHGKCLLVIKSGNSASVIKLSAKSLNLKSSDITLITKE